MFRSLDNFLLKEYSASPRGLAVYRILFAFLFLILMLPMNTAIGALPDSFYNPPPSLGKFFFEGFPSVGFLKFLNTLSFLSVFLLLLGYQTRLVSITLGLVGLLHANFFFSTGKIEHTILIYIIPLLMSGSGWGNHYSIDALLNRRVRNPQPAACLAILALIIGFGMFTAGYQKLMTGWLSPDSHATAWYFYENLLSNGREPVLAPMLVSIDGAWFWESKDWITVFFELLLLPAAFSKRLFYFLLAVCGLFHLAVYLTFEISFAVNVVAYAAFLPYASLVRGDTAKDNPAQDDPPAKTGAAATLFPIMLISVLLLIAVLLAAQGFNPVTFAMEAVLGGLTVGGLIVSLGAAVAMIYFGWFALGFIRRARRSAEHKPSELQHPVMLFDGVCGLCSHTVDYVMKRDKQGQFRFTPLQSEYGQSLLQGAGMPKDYLDSILLIDQDGLHSHSDAILRIARHLGGPYRFTRPAGLFPRLIRDMAYDFVATYRYKWFGQHETCRMPTPEERERFIVEPPAKQDA